MSRNAVRRLRSERELCEREAARCSSRAIPDPPSRKLMTVSSCSMPSSRGSDAAPTREGSSPSSLANVYRTMKTLYAAPQKKNEREIGNKLTLHSLLVSTIRSPSTRPQPPHTRSPLPNSSTMLGLGSLHSGQMRRTAKSGPYVGCWTFCAVAARGNGCENAMLSNKDAEGSCGRGFGSEW